MSKDVMPCEHGSYGLCPQCVREERDRLRAELSRANEQLESARDQHGYLVSAAAFDEVCDERDSLRAELADVRADRDRYSDLLDVSQGCVRELRRLLDEARKQEPVGEVCHGGNRGELLTWIDWKESPSDMDSGTKLYAAPVPAKPVAFNDNGEEIEARLARNTEHLNCPSCGGSGHVDDVAQAAVNMQGGYCCQCGHELCDDCAPLHPHPTVPDDVAKDAAEVVAYRIHYPGGAKRLTEDGDVYEHEKRAGLKIDWLGVVGGIDAAILSATDTEGRKDE